MTELHLKEHHLVLANTFLQLARELEAENKPVAGMLFEKHCHQFDLANDSILTVSRIGLAMKNVARELMRELMRNNKLTLEEVQEVSCINETFHVLRLLGIKEIAMYDEARTIITL